MYVEALPMAAKIYPYPALSRELFLRCLAKHIFVSPNVLCFPLQILVPAWSAGSRYRGSFQGLHSSSQPLFSFAGFGLGRRGFFRQAHRSDSGHHPHLVGVVVVGSSNGGRGDSSSISPRRRRRHCRFCRSVRRRRRDAKPPRRARQWRWRRLSSPEAAFRGGAVHARFRQRLSKRDDRSSLTLRFQSRNFTAGSSGRSGGRCRITQHHCTSSLVVSRLVADGENSRCLCDYDEDAQGS